MMWVKTWSAEELAAKRAEAEARCDAEEAADRRRLRRTPRHDIRMLMRAGWSAADASRSVLGY